MFFHSYRNQFLFPSKSVSKAKSLFRCQTRSHFQLSESFEALSWNFVIVWTERTIRYIVQYRVSHMCMYVQKKRKNITYVFTFVSIYMGHPVLWYVLQYYIRSIYCIMCIVFIQIHAFHVVTCTLFVNCPVPNFSRNLSGIQQRMWNIAHLNNWMIYASPPFLTSTYVD